MKTTDKLKNTIFHIKRWKKVAFYLVFYDAAVVNISYLLALWFRFDCQFTKIRAEYLGIYAKFAPVYTVFCLLVFWRVALYNSIWRYASFVELTRLTKAAAITTVFNVAGTLLFAGRMPVSYYVFGALLQFLFMTVMRFSYRFVLLVRSVHTSKKENGSAPGKHVMLIGAGSAGQMILRDINNSKETNDVVKCIIDDNSDKWNRVMDGVLVVGGRDDILINVEKYAIDKIYLAIPSATSAQKRDILNICSETGCELKNLPGMYQFVNGEVTVTAMKEVAVEDLLGRDPIRVDMDEIFAYNKDKVILVTGGGGSIGSELCRQLAGHSPRQLIIFDVYENNAYEIEQELKSRFPDLNLVTLIGSVRDSRRIEQVYREYRPDITYHAAAHKHVPLMEGSPCEAVKNNVYGTYKTAYAALKYGCGRFVLISTDKAVNPTNIMGASKRVCEMIIQTFDRMAKEGRTGELREMFEHSAGKSRPDDAAWKSKKPTEFVAVRFGNVLGSNGSVIPLFKKQIAMGGPVTVTHPDIIRYFMTIPEAVSLVLQAGVYAQGGEIFVLDMGSPVKIDTLARNLIKLSGFKPDIDIRIEYTGLRPGEKLYEEKLMEEEGLKTTRNHLIHVGRPISFDEDVFLDQLYGLVEEAYENSSDIRSAMEKIVDTYHPAK